MNAREEEVEEPMWLRFKDHYLLGRHLHEKLPEGVLE